MQIWGKAQLYATALTFANALYICRKELGKKEALNSLRNLFAKLNVSPLGQTEYDAAMLLPFKDVEDNLQYCSAVSAGCDFLVTRNVKDFPDNEQIAVMAPQGFLDTFMV